MASSEDAALKILQGQVESLTAQLQTLTSERDEYRDALSEVAEERDGLRTAPDAAARIAELEAAARDRTHYDRFAELAKGAKAKDKALKQLWRDAKDRGYKPESDDVDDQALQSAVKTLKTEVDYAFDPEENATTTAAKDAAKVTSRTKYGLELRGEEPPAGGGRSDRNKGGDGTIITAEMRADPKFMLDPKNKQIIGDAAREGRFR
ncbi:MAG: hypothetical protein ABSH35_20585 [Isosphaeraceae bacterium]|jgi:predicted metal-dependent phosphoesterase TrpH